MKLGSLADRLSGHCGMLFTELPLPERFAAAARAGFAAVEYMNLFATSAREVASWLERAGVPLAQTAFPAGDVSRGEMGFAALPDRVPQYRASVEPTLDYVETLGCRMVHPLAGIRPHGAPREALWDTYLENLAFVADAARRRDMTVIVEWIGPGSIADYAIDDPTMAVEAIRAVGRSNVKLLFDTFQCAYLGYDPATLIRAYDGLIAHVQMADHPGRHEPGTGRIDFDAVFQALQETDFTGFVGCEYHPTSTTETSFGWMRAS